MKIIMSRGDRRGNALVIHLPRTVNVIAQTVVEVGVASPFLNLVLVVEFDFRNQQAREPTRVIVQTTLFFTDFDRQLGLADTIASRAAERSRVAGNKCGLG